MTDFFIGANWENKTANRIKIQPMILSNSKTWFKIIQAAITANTHSKDYIIAAGASSIFFCANICSVKAKPPDKTQAYIIEELSKKIFEIITSSKV